MNFGFVVKSSIYPIYRLVLKHCLPKRAVPTTQWEFQYPKTEVPTIYI